MFVSNPEILMNQPMTAPDIPNPLSESEFDRLFEAARPTLRVVAGAECGFDLADDAVQQAAIIALDKIAEFEPGTNFTAWTAAIVRGVARNTRRGEKRLRLRQAKHSIDRRDSTPADHTHAAALPNTGIRPGAEGPEVHIPESFDPDLREALSRLTPEQRACLLLRTLLEHPYDTIAELLAIPTTTARSHVYRARTRLLDELSPSLAQGSSVR